MEDERARGSEWLRAARVRRAELEDARVCLLVQELPRVWCAYLESLYACPCESTCCASVGE